MDASHISRLRQEQDVALQNTEENIVKWEKFKSDYEALRERLKTLPDKVSHPVMVPFGSVGLMPGRLVHTNEITVLLGDNWFAERSAKQAAEIVTRRLKSVTDNLDQLYGQRKLLTPRQVFTRELQDIAEGVSDVQDIVEQYDSDTEREWRVQHKKNVRAHREKLRKEENESSVEAVPRRAMSDDALWARLDELERRETERDELRGDDEEDDDDAQTKGRQLPSPGSARVSWADEAVDDGSDTSCDDDMTTTSGSDYDTDTEEEVALKKMATITFTHSTQKKSSSSEEVDSSKSVPHIVSPSDIYKHFGQPSKPKSILKQKKVKHKVEMERQQAMKERENLINRTPAKTKQAFTGTVVEKEEKTSTTAPTTSTTSTTTSATTSHRPVSRFKAQRSQRGCNR